MHKKICLTAGIAMLALLFAQAVVPFAEAGSGRLRLHLPREAAVRDKVIRLGDIAAASGEENTVRKLEAVALGTITLASQEVVIDRYTILTRLGSSGIDTSQVTLTGAERVSVKLARSSISSAELLAEAERFAARIALPPNQIYRALDMPEDVSLGDGGGKLDVASSLVGKAGDNPLIVRLAVMVDGQEAAVREVRFTPVPRSSRQAAAAAPATETNRPARPAAAEDSPRVVFRNRPVTIEIAVPGLSMTAMGLALEDGRAGQVIRVRNMDSKRNIVTRVNADGSVSPVF
ncbi:MAG TPA: flagella basal body P-ring formation protein FlgA [Sedimentisphaerales bacterium]|nr:flagella basal body P-ring formation protein FlgA [Sedimentisphaerales bacterium]